MKVILINGPMGVGKTAVGKRIAEQTPGTAFIDGDWCMDLHPFVGNQETKAMAIDNILHLIGSYQKCTLCQRIVVVWLMDEGWVYRQILEGISAMGLEPVPVTLVCGEEALIRRWKNDDAFPWRTDGWLQVSLKSLPYFCAMENCLDTTQLSIDQAAQEIMRW